MKLAKDKVSFKIRLAGFIVLLGKTHYLIAVGGFVMMVTHIEAKESWQRSILLALGVDAGFYVLFDLILKVQILNGLL